MSGSALTSDFPVPNDFIQPFEMLTGWPSSDHRNARRVERDAKALIHQLEFIVAMHLEIEVGKPELGTQAERDEFMLELLQSMRTLHAELLGGIRVRRIRRDVEHYTPQLKPALQQSIDAARARLVQMRSVLAFMTGENDDAELGVELLPDAGEPLPPEDSRPPA
jgi:hypothetical protein